MRKTVLSIVFLMAGMAMFAALPGTTCLTAKPLGQNFQENITGPSVVWYEAWTFDLPLTVYFAPQNESDPAPEVEMDFSCTSGYYTDSILCSLFCKTSGSSGIDFGLPHKPPLSVDRLPDGRLVYYLSLGKKYRDLLLQMGISYNLKVVVKVTYKSAGEISIAPNDLFSNCMDGHKFIKLGDTVQVKVRDTQRHVIVPYVQWQEDSIRYVWEGAQPVTIAISAACDIDPTNNADERILDFYTLNPPRDTLKLTSSEVRYYVHADDHSSEAGMFYAKFYSEGAGIMTIERVPQAPPQGGATLLRYDKPTPVPANDFNALFAIPYTWTTATRFDVPTDHIFRMYIGTTYDFTKETAIASYQFSRKTNGHWLGLQTSEMEALWTNTTAQYLYVRFECSEKTSITPKTWRPSDCLTTTRLIERNSEITIIANSTTIYRIYYPDWKDGNMSVSWSKTDVCKMLVAGTCLIGTSQTSDMPYYKELKNSRTYTIQAADIATWENYADEDGFLYIRFHTTASGGGKIGMHTAAPEEEDPAPIVYPAASISVDCNGDPDPVNGQQFIVRVVADQTLNLYSGPADNIASRTPLQTWSQNASETHNITLQSGVYTLVGTGDSVQIEVK